MKDSLIYEYFSDDDFLLFSDKIKEVEAKTSGEIRLSMHHNHTNLQSKPDIKALAEKEFHRLNLHNTRDKTGMLIYINLKLRQFYILGDTGINEKVEQKHWDFIRDEIQSAFTQGKYVEGILLGIEHVGNTLAKFFPAKEANPNEIADDVVL